MLQFIGLNAINIFTKHFDNSFRTSFFKNTIFPSSVDFNQKYTKILPFY